MEKIKDFISKYIIFILILLIVIVVVLLLLPNNNNEEKPTPTESTLTLTLKGNKEVSIIQGEKYQDPGYIASDSKEGDLTGRVIVEGNVNTNIVDSYIIKYSVSNSTGKVAEATRTVKVIADLKDMKVSVDYSPKEITNKEISITINATGSGYDFILDPDGSVHKENKYTYKVTNNGEYLFSVKRKDGTIIEKSVEIKNIDKKKPTGSCKSTLTGDKTTISVTANDENGISKFSYNLNDKKYDSTSNSYTASGTIRNVSVTIYDKASNYEIVSCITTDNTWPVMGNQNYVATTPKHYDKSQKYNNMNYIIYYPNDLDLTKKNPLVIYLHGSGEFGTSIDGSFNSNTAFVNNMRDGKFNQKAVFLAPQCTSKNKSWRNDCFDNLKGLIDETVRKYNIDSKRISICGHSMGGGATVDAIVKCTNFISAAVLLAPPNVSASFSGIKNIRLAVFTGTNDSLYGYSKNDVNKMQQLGIQAKLYTLEGMGHNVQPKVFNESNAIEWMIGQSLN